MSSREVNSIVHSIEKSSGAGDSHIHNLSQAFKEIHQLQENDGGASSAQFKADMKDVNTRLQADGVLPNLEFTSTDNANHIIMKDVQSGRTEVQDSTSVNDYGGSERSEAKPSPEQAVAKLLGIDMSGNPDGSWNVRSPLDDQQGGMKILSTMENAMLGGDTTNQQNQADTPSVPGLNPLMAQSLFGSPDSSMPDETTDNSSDSY